MSSKLKFFIVGASAGFILGTNMYYKMSVPVQAFIETKEQCEQNLPRSQHCIVEYIGKPVKEND